MAPSGCLAPDLGRAGGPELRFQRVVDLATGRLLGFEALLHWQDPVRGSISPQELLPWAEAHGHMAALNAWVLSEACTRAVRWASGIQLAVNCSVCQLQRHEVASSWPARPRGLRPRGRSPDRRGHRTFFAGPVAADEALALTRMGLPIFPLSDSHSRHLRRTPE